jgi:hypothetical protein
MTAMFAMLGWWQKWLTWVNSRFQNNKASSKLRPIPYAHQFEMLFSSVHNRTMGQITLRNSPYCMRPPWRSLCVL